MAEVVMYVEAWDETNQTWKTVGKLFSGDEDEIRPEAEALQQEWLDSGWPKSEIRISKSAFREFNKKWRED